MTFGYACLRRERSLTSRCDLFLCSFRGWAFRTKWDGTRRRGCAADAPISCSTPVMNCGPNLLLLPKYEVDVLDVYAHYEILTNLLLNRIEGFKFDSLLV